MIGEILREAGLITKKHIEEALEYKQEHGVKLGQALVALEYVTEADLSAALKEQGKIHCLKLHPELVDEQVARKMGEEFSRKHGAIAINEIAGTVTVAMRDPTDVYAVDDMIRTFGARVIPVFAASSSIDRCMDMVFRAAPEVETAALDELATSAEIDGRTFDTALLEEAEEMDEEDESHPVVSLIKGILHEGFQSRASDIHLETRRRTFNVRFRVDGTLYDRLSMPKAWARPCVARLKVLSNLDIAQRRLPQDGRAQFEIDGRRVDLRVATTPSLPGESVVIRILDGGRELHSIENLGLDTAQIDQLTQTVEAREGFMLATGPTGSGKTTTLYALLQRLHTPDRKIITLEDPVENHIDGITQINTNVKAGLTFSRGLRSILRQDPDVVLVGEIRDEETAAIGVQASLTGHMVLSTLHTVGTAESITRLSEMGIERFLLADTLRGIVAQRLVRKICDHCKEPARPDPSLLDRLGIPGDESAFYEGAGCSFCHNTGFYGRLGIYEIMVMDPDICDVLRKGADTSELRKVAVENGMTTLREEGLKKARAGETTLEEIITSTAFS